MVAGNAIGKAAANSDFVQEDESEIAVQPPARKLGQTNKGVPNAAKEAQGADDGLPEFSSRQATARI